MLNEQPLFVQPPVKPGCTTGLTTGCIHDTTGYYTTAVLVLTQLIFRHVQAAVLLRLIKPLLRVLSALIAADDKTVTLFYIGHLTDCVGHEISLSLCNFGKDTILSVRVSPTSLFWRFPVLRVTDSLQRSTRIRSWFLLLYTAKMLDISALLGLWLVTIADDTHVCEK